MVKKWLWSGRASCSLAELYSVFGHITAGTVSLSCLVCAFHPTEAELLFPGVWAGKAAGKRGRRRWAPLRRRRSWRRTTTKLMSRALAGTQAGTVQYTPAPATQCTPQNTYGWTLQRKTQKLFFLYCQTLNRSEFLLSVSVSSKFFFCICYMLK